MCALEITNSGDGQSCSRSLDTWISLSIFMGTEIMPKYGRKGLNYLEISKLSLETCALVLKGKHAAHHNLIPSDLSNSNSVGMAALRNITALVRMGSVTLQQQTAPVSQDLEQQRLVSDACCILDRLESLL